MVENSRILLIRGDGIGDAALCIPALQGLSAAYPGAYFGAVCSPANAELYSARMQRIYVFDSALTHSSQAEQLRRDRYTHALIATEEVAGYKLARASGARVRAGFWHGWQKPFKSLWQHAQVTRAVYRPAVWSQNGEHEVTTIYRLAQALGAIAPVPIDARTLRSWLRIEGASAARCERRFAFQITPKLLTLGWGPAALAEMIVVVLRVSGLEHCDLVAAATDEGLACAILEQVPTAARTEGRISLVTSLAVPSWLGQLASCKLVVTPDTGAAHVAGMLGVPVIDIFERDGFERLARQWRPWAAPARCFAKPPWHARAPEMFGTEIGVAARELAL